MSTLSPWYIGKGTYGCVFTPAFQCDDKTFKDRLTAGKIFFNANNFKEEMDMLKRVETFDPDNKWSLKVLNGCRAKIVDPVVLHTCGITSHGNKKLYYQIVMENGGQSLKHMSLLHHTDCTMI